jgi:hypothetical protein
MEIINTIGRRKTAIARIYMQEGQGKIVVNGRDFTEYFPTSILQFKVTEPYQVTETTGKYDLKVLLDGGGRHLTRTLQDQRGVPPGPQGQGTHDARPPHGGTQEIRTEKGP